MIYNLYIYNRKGKCLFYREWNRPLNTLSDDPEEEKKLMFGMLFSLKDLTSKLAPITSSGTPGNDVIHVVKTNSYTLHHFQSLSGMMFVLNTDPAAPDLYPNLQHIYSNIYTECIARNPLYHHHPDEGITCPLFFAKLEEYILALPCAK